MGAGIPQTTVSSCTPTATGRSIAKRWMWHHRVLQGAFERLELLEGKLSRAVLRGLGGSNPARLSGDWVNLVDLDCARLAATRTRSAADLLHEPAPAASCWAFVHSSGLAGPPIPLVNDHSPMANIGSRARL